ncbi:MAG: 6-hydroxymethylpterin diphosphokinase MptE-like protein [Chloroflexota bacterium]
MSAISEPVKRLLRTTLGAERGDRIIGTLVDAKSRVEYALSPSGRRSSAQLARMRDRHAGERCVIVGNGPSLREMDLAPLRSEETFGLNRGYLLFQKLGFAPTYLVAINANVVDQFASEILAESSTTFVSWHTRRFLPRGHRAILMRPVRGPLFSTDPARGIWGGATVTFAALQLAYHMGFSEVVLIGVDHSFSTPGPAHQLVTSSGDDPNHFDPSYFGKGVRWELPNLPLSEVAYRLARKAFEADGRRILDATVGGKLTVFPKVELEAALRPRADPHQGSSLEPAAVRPSS